MSTLLLYFPSLSAVLNGSRVGSSGSTLLAPTLLGLTFLTACFISYDVLFYEENYYTFLGVCVDFDLSLLYSSLSFVLNHIFPNLTLFTFSCSMLKDAFAGMGSDFLKESVALSVSAIPVLPAFEFLQRLRGGFPELCRLFFFVFCLSVYDAAITKVLSGLKTLGSKIYSHFTGIFKVIELPPVPQPTPPKNYQDFWTKMSDTKEYIDFVTAFTRYRVAQMQVNTSKNTNTVTDPNEFNLVLFRIAAEAMDKVAEAKDKAEAEVMNKVIWSTSLTKCTNQYNILTDKISMTGNSSWTLASIPQTEVVSPMCVISGLPSGSNKLNIVDVAVAAQLTNMRALPFGEKPKTILEKALKSDNKTTKNLSGKTSAGSKKAGKGGKVAGETKENSN